MSSNVPVESHYAKSEGWTPLTREGFWRLVARGKLHACAQALAPILSERPALMRLIERADATVVWCTGSLSPRDQVVDAFAVIPNGGGAIAAVVHDELPRANRERRSSRGKGDIVVSEIDRARARKVLKERGYVVGKGRP